MEKLTPTLVRRRLAQARVASTRDQFIAVRNEICDRVTYKIVENQLAEHDGVRAFIPLRNVLANNVRLDALDVMISMDADVQKHLDQLIDLDIYTYGIGHGVGSRDLVFMVKLRQEKTENRE